LMLTGTQITDCCLTLRSKHRVKPRLGKAFVYSDRSICEKCGTKGTENSLSVWLGGKEYEPEDISAEILKKVLQNAQNYQQSSIAEQKSKITQAVITIPAYFNDKQRHATQIAATRAGLEQCELLPEPTAAAISYGFKPDSEDVKTILVYDFGGGTFDSCIVTSAGNQFIESGKAGDLWLGGDDIDDRIIDFVKEQVAEAEDLDDIDGLIDKMPHYKRVRFLGLLKIAVEQAKINLSKSSKEKIITEPLLDDLGMAIDVCVEITREQFESIILPMVERSIAVCKEAIKYSDYPEDMIDVVLLVGGSSQIPLVQQKVKEAFGAERVVVHPRPMYAVAEGAAIVARGLVEKVGTVSRDYCIELVNDPRHKLIKQGDILPVKTTHTFRTEADGQSLIHFKFYSPDDVSKRDDERIGDMWLALDKSYPQGTEVLVTAELDEKNGSLQTTAILKNDPYCSTTTTNYTNFYYCF
ncbi:MAG: Hsp70 family protein, partial [Pleurocapsa sp. SU_5_0]|nr:Hsp70 family protein [Pleurocapsa sp. SU_5_0]